MGNFQHRQTPQMSRREMLCQCSAGFGGLALASLISEASAASNSSAYDPLSPKMPHFAASETRHLLIHAWRSVARRSLRLQARTE